MPDTLPELLSQIEAAYRRGDYDRGLALVRHVFELKRTDVSTFDRLGSIYYVLGRYGEALTIWQRALPLEKDVKRRQELQNSIVATRRSLGLPEEAAAASPAAPRPARRPRKKADPELVRRLYRRGIKHYAGGEYLQATTTFLRILELDPSNADAKKALERLRVEPGARPAPAAP